MCEVKYFTFDFSVSQNNHFLNLMKTKLRKAMSCELQALLDNTL